MSEQIGISLESILKANKEKFNPQDMLIRYWINQNFEPSNLYELSKNDINKSILEEFPGANLFHIYEDENNSNTIDLNEEIKKTSNFCCNWLPYSFACILNDYKNKDYFKENLPKSIKIKHVLWNDGSLINGLRDTLISCVKILFDKVIFNEKYKNEIEQVNLISLAKMTESCENVQLHNKERAYQVVKSHLTNLKFLESEFNFIYHSAAYDGSNFAKNQNNDGSSSYHGYCICNSCSHKSN